MAVTVVKPSPDCHPGYTTWKKFDGERGIHANTYFEGYFAPTKKPPTWGGLVKKT
jgi:hypothetical protein